MTERTFYIDIDEGHQDSSLMEIRRIAMDWLWTHPDERSVTVYSSPSKTRTVGMVTVNHSRSAVFAWIVPKGAVKTLFRNGGLYKNRNN